MPRDARVTLLSPVWDGHRPWRAQAAASSLRKRPNAEAGDCRGSGAGDLLFQLGPACEQSIDLGLALLDGGEQRRQLGVIARVLGVLAVGARRAQRRLRARERMFDRVVLALLFVAELLAAGRRPRRCPVGC